MKEDQSGKPALSVVIPTLGRPILIQTLRSLIEAQGFDRIEVLVAGNISDASVSKQVHDFQTSHSQIKHLPVSFAKGDSSEKKNAGWREASADIVAFLDDDVVVAADWPLRVLEAFADERTALISGPGLVPPDAQLFARLAGVTLSSPAAGYVAWRYRHASNELIPVNWSKIIGCNMAYRRSVLEEIGGFDPAFWPGEEMIASHRTQQSGHQLLFYSPAYVYHYPRHSLGRFWKQIFGYGATRVRLIRAGVEFEPTTIVPGLWVAALFGSLVLTLFWPPWVAVLAGLIAAYAVVDLAITVMMVNESRQWRDALIFFLIPVMHLSYGLAEWSELLCGGRDLSMKPDGE